MEKIFITGGTGFVGSHIINQLIRTGIYSIKALKRPSSDLTLISNPDSIDWIDVDIYDTLGLMDTLEDVDFIIHCAAVVSFDNRDFAAMYRTNVEGTTSLINAALVSNITRFVHISSIAALGKPPNKSVIDENSDWYESDSTTQYAISKHLSEREVWRGAAEGLEIVVLNPSVVIGEGYWHAGTGAFFDRMYTGNRYYPTGTTGFVYVKDVADISIKALTEDCAHQRYIISSENLSFKAFMDLIAQNFGTKETSQPLKGMLAKMLPILGGIKAVLLRQKKQLSAASIRASQQKIYYNNRKSIGAFNHKYLSIAEAVKKTCAEYLDDL